jgi:hypothetical protein
MRSVYRGARLGVVTVLLTRDTGHHSQPQVLAWNLDLIASRSAMGMAFLRALCFDTTRSHSHHTGHQLIISLRLLPQQTTPNSQLYEIDLLRTFPRDQGAGVALTRLFEHWVGYVDRCANRYTKLSAGSRS